MSGGEFDFFSWLRAVGRSGGLLSASERSVLFALVPYASGSTGGDIRPGYARLAADAGMTVRGVKNVCRRLESAGVLRVVHAGGGRTWARVWALSFPDGLSGAPENHAPPFTDSGRKGAPPFTDSGRKGAPPFTVTSEKGCTPVQERVNGHAEKGAPPFTPPTQYLPRTYEGEPPSSERLHSRGSNHTAPPPRFCSKHPDGTDVPCRGCATARERRAAWNERHGGASATGQASGRDSLDAHARAAGAAMRDAVARCSLCDEAGWRIGEDGGATTTRCDHTADA